ncbi:MAG: hypothetical protein AAGC73_01525, partial [Verrucomicrobiota bacterium]
TCTKSGYGGYLLIEQMDDPSTIRTEHIKLKRFDTQFTSKEIRTDINLTKLKDEDEGFMKRLSSYRKSGSHLSIVEYVVSCQVSATYLID